MFVDSREDARVHGEEDGLRRLFHLVQRARGFVDFTAEDQRPVQSQLHHARASERVDTRFIVVPHTDH